MNVSGIKTFLAGEALAARRLVKAKSGTTKDPIEVELCGAGEDALGVTEYAAANGDAVAVRLLNTTGTFEIEVGATITRGQLLYVAASGKASNVSSGSVLGQALETGEDGARIECFIDPRKRTTAAGTTLLDEAENTAAANVEAAIAEIYKGVEKAFADPGDAEAIPVTRNGVYALTVGAADETRTIAAPDAEGRMILVTVKATGGGAVTLTIAGNSNYLGDSDLVLTAAGQSVLLIGTIVATTRVWRAVNLSTDLTFIPVAIADPGDAGAIPVTRNGVCAITTAGAETRTLAAPDRVGREITLCLDVDGGDAVITAATAVNVAGNNTLTMDTAGEYITLKATQKAGDLLWSVIANDGVGLTTV